MNPIAWWNALPATTREPIQSFVVSSALAIQSTTVAAFAVGYGLGLCGSPEATLHFFGTAWWGIFIGTFFGVGPYYRAKQGAIAATNTVTLADGTKAVITPPKGP